MTKVLFVCHGNICRSPMAEFVMKDLAKKAGVADRFEIASVGVSAEELGNPMYPSAQQELTRHGVPCSGHRARKITQADCDHFDHIYYMDSANARSLQRLFPDHQKFQPFLPRDVADPWYYGNFAQTWEDISKGCARILEELL